MKPQPHPAAYSGSGGPGAAASGETDAPPAGDTWSHAGILTMVCHDLRTPLQGLNGLLQWMASSPLPPDQQEHLELARQCGTNLQNMLEGLLECLLCEDAGFPVRREACDLVQLLRSLETVFQFSAQEQEIMLRFEISPELGGRWLTDEVKLNQILLNLISNAIKYTPAGFVRVGARLVRLTDPVLQVEIEDSGAGIEAAQLPRVFEMFSRGGKDEDGFPAGTGLGLAIAGRLTQAMKGRIQITSREDQGTRILLTLPVAPV